MNACAASERLDVLDYTSVSSVEALGCASQKRMRWRTGEYVFANNMRDFAFELYGRVRPGYV
eukprot:2954072-Pleurochrysis_carterae.AAC.1